MYYKKIIKKIIQYINHKVVRLKQHIIFNLPYFTKRSLKKEVNATGIIGCGHIIKNLYIYALNKKEINIECKSLLSNNIHDAIHVKRSLIYKSDCYDNYELFSNSGLNSIIITTPNYSHYEYITKGIENKFNIFCEKPLTNNLTEALHIKDLIKKYPIVLMVGFHIRYSSIFRKLKSILQNNDFGNISNIHVYHFINIKEHITSSDWLNDKNKSGGGVLFNVGIHSINLLLALLGNVSEVSANLENLILPVSSGEDTAFCRLNFEAGTSCYLKLSYLNNSNKDKKFIMRIYCKHGVIICNFYDKHICLIDHSKNSQKYIFFDELEHDFIYNELNYFVNCINKNITPETDINDSIKTMLVINALYQSDNRQVTIASFKSD